LPGSQSDDIVYSFMTFGSSLVALFGTKEVAILVDTNVGALKKHWKRFVWMWMFPPVFLATALVPQFHDHPMAFFLLVDLPLFFVCYFIASKPVRRHEVTARQGVVAIVVLPVAIWASLVFGLFGLIALFGAVT
jgi:hypothetical protein